MSRLTLYTYWRSTASYRVRIALHYKNLPYEPIPVNLLAGEQRGDVYKAQNPMGYLPCLVIDGEKFVESTAILELLEELHPEPSLFPGGPKDRAHIRALMQIVNSGIQPLQNLTVLDRVGDDADRRKAWMMHFITRGLAAWEQLATSFGTKGPFAYGDRFTSADVLLIPQIYAARRNGVDVDAFPRIRGVEQATADLPFVKAAHPDAQPDARPA
jgi:maleylpyruvate isomerase